jgi:transmembrane sensor
MAADAGPPTRIDAEALDWVLRIDDPGFADWDAHLAWLERSPEHAAAFDRLSLLVDDSGAAVSAAPPPPSAASHGERSHVVANDNAPPPARRNARWWIGGAAAIAASALAVFATTLGGGPAETLVRTRAGEHRTLALVDGTTIAMNGGTSIRLAGLAAREVAIESGEAFFTVRHDAARPFSVRIGDDVVRDVGTAFDVALGAAGATVAVQEGEVAYEARHGSVRLPAGRRLVVYKGVAAVSRVDPSSVGGWRSGRLVYRDATLAEVAADLSRAVGEPVTATASARVDRFTGVIVVDHDRRRTFERVEAVTGARAVHGAGGWRLIAPTR